MRTAKLVLELTAPDTSALSTRVPRNVLKETRHLTHRYGTLDFPLRANESITWEWQDADFTRNRESKIPVFGKGRLEYKPTAANLVKAGSGFVGRLIQGKQQIELSSNAERAQLVIPVLSPYPILDGELVASVTGSVAQVKVRISKDKGSSWVAIEPTTAGGLSSWRFKMDEPEKWAYPAERALYTDTTRTIVAGQLWIHSGDKSQQSRELIAAHFGFAFDQYLPALPARTAILESRTKHDFVC